MVVGKSPEWLPPGFTEKIKVKDGRKIKVYTDSSTGNKFYSRPAVIRYLGTENQSDTPAKKIKLEVEDESSSKSEISPQSQLEVEDELSSKFVISPQMMPTDSSGCNSERKNKGKHSFKMVACESESADGIPPGWIVEIKTSKSGNKIRNDRYYIDPNSGYIFYSKKDVMRYLENRDISNCATRPKKMESGDLQLIKNEIHSSYQDNKLSNHIETEQRLAPGESDSGRESSSAKSPEAPDAKISEPTQNNSARSLEDNESCENSNKDAEMKIGTEPTESRENSMKDAEMKIDAELTEEVKATDQALPKTDSESHQKLPSSGIEKQADEALVSSRKSKKRKGLSLPSRVSKRLAGCKAEIQSELVPSKQAHRVSAKRSPSSEVKTLPSSSLETVADIPLSSGVSPSKEIATLPIVVNETPQEIEPVKNVENPLVEKEAILVEKQAADSTRSQKSQLCFGFGNAWPDPCLEFAIKTLTEEIPYEETLAFSGCFRDLSSIPCNQSNEFSKPSDSDVPGVFQSEIPAHSEPLKYKGALGLSRDKNISFPACCVVSCQQFSSEAMNKDCAILPVSQTEKQTAKAAVLSLRKSKKREDLSLASQTSEKLAWSGIATTLEFVGEKTLQQVVPLDKVNKPLVENQAIPDDKHKPKDNAISKESQLCYEFGSSWSDPCLDFAFKTLTGEVPVEETFAFSGRFGNQSGVPYNQAKNPIKPSGSVVPTIFQNEIPRHSEQLKKNNVVHVLPGNNISFPACSGLSSQQSSLEARNMEYQTKVSLRK